MNEYTQEIRVFDDSTGTDITEVVSFPQCLDMVTEEEKKSIISSIMVKYLNERKVS